MCSCELCEVFFWNIIGCTYMCPTWQRNLLISLSHEKVSTTVLVFQFTRKCLHMNLYFTFVSVGIYVRTWTRKKRQVEDRRNLTVSHITTQNLDQTWHNNTRNEKCVIKSILLWCVSRMYNENVEYCILF